MWWLTAALFESHEGGSTSDSSELRIKPGLPAPPIGRNAVDLTLPLDGDHPYTIRVDGRSPPFAQ